MQGGTVIKALKGADINQSTEMLKKRSESLMKIKIKYLIEKQKLKDRNSAWCRTWQVVH